MFCQQCGTRVNPDGEYCTKCGVRILSTTLAPPAMTRPTAVTVLAVLQFIGGALWGLAGAAVAVAGIAGPRAAQGGPGSAMAATLLVAAAAYQIVCGIGLWRLRNYGRIMQMISAAIGLLGIPIGTVIAIIVLVYLTKPGIRLLFADKRPEELTPEEIGAVQAVTSGSGGLVIIVIVVALVVLAIPVVGIIAAIAVPGLLRARIAGNEAVAIGTLRAISSGEASYAAANAGYYDSQECLASPTNCLTNYREGPFLAEAYRTKSGFRFELGGTAAPDDRDPKTSRSSLSHFVVLALPLSPSTGSRMFCVDDSGVLRWQRGEYPVPAEAAACPAAWQPVQ